MIKRSVCAAIFLTLFLFPAALFAGGNTYPCATNYRSSLPMRATDDMLGDRLLVGHRRRLEDEGANVYAAAVNCMDSTANKALQFKQQFLQVLAVTGKSRT